MLYLFLKSLIVGFCIAAPVGPIGILCIHRSLQKGFKSGFITGCGAAVADGGYGAMAAFGLASLSSWLVSYSSWIQLLGGFFLLYLGITIFNKIAIAKKAVTDKDDRPLHDFFSTFILTLTNPLTILSFIAVFAGLGLVDDTSSYTEAWLIVLGCMLGSLFWWLVLSASVGLWLHHKITQRTMQWINRFSGGILVVFGIIVLINVAVKYFFN